MTVSVNYLIRADARQTASLPQTNDAGFLTSVKRLLDKMIASGGMFEVATIVMWGGSLPPAGWLLCDGSIVDRTAFPSLFERIGTTYGAGDGSTTFSLPDLRATAPVGDAAPPTTIVSGGSVVPATAGVADPAPAAEQTGGTGGNTFVGGRTRLAPGEQER